MQFSAVSGLAESSATCLIAAPDVASVARIEIGP